ncbi:unnamed protein product [Adineta steineri]|uniref:Uncharacterized protein n=1 Tax=Adineta steineri TaxID=433720 RepID=A0A819VMF4_9BILA|nr:unnamed protein product [Adineta steineri]
MCIAEDFWLDGENDCMDWSDEYFINFGHDCSFNPGAMECDEHSCLAHLYSCGDGECVRWETRMAFQRYAEAEKDCYTKRNLNFMCEFSPHRSAWTLESGLCLPDEGYDDPRYLAWDMMNESELTDDEKCQYLFRCLLSQDIELDCPCHYRNCIEMMMNVCPNNQYILYPPQGLIDSITHFWFDYTQSVKNANFEYLTLKGAVRCPGYFLQTRAELQVQAEIRFVERPNLLQYLCTIDNPEHVYRDSLSPHQYDKFCWNNSVTFNGRPYAVEPDICKYAGCLSQYRILDGLPDCFFAGDEKMTYQNYCTGNVGRHRFQCFDDQNRCFTLLTLGTGFAHCSNNYDETWFDTGIFLRERMPCEKDDLSHCDHLKAYIIQSSAKNTTNHSSFANVQPSKSSNRIRFRSYCDTFWDLKGHLDEMTSSCRHWICPNNQYQCRTGQCIPLIWVCDGEWDCADASDEEAIVLIKRWAGHNARLPGLLSQIEKCRQLYFRSPFSRICNTSFEVGCLRSGVENPLDIKSNRPCINLTQIGDEVEDCYNACQSICAGSV